jgi:hypothetical protein
MSITEEQLAAFMALREAATPGEWRAGSHGTMSNGTPNPAHFVTGPSVLITSLARADADFVAAAVNAFPVLVEALRGERATNEELRAALAQQQERADVAEAEGAVMREALDELAELMRGVITGDYVPDSFTTQPADAALAGDVGRSFLESRARLRDRIVELEAERDVARADVAKVRAIYASKEGGK